MLRTIWRRRPRIVSGKLLARKECADTLNADISLQLAGIVVLGIFAQWLAWRLRVPGILLLLLCGFAVGAGSEWFGQHGWTSHHRLLDPDHLFGDLLLPGVSLTVAIILFEGGLTLNIAELSQNGGVIWRLVSIGALVSWIVCLLAARFILGLDWPVAVLLGAILVVTGPTVIGPLLRDVRPTGQVGPILKWEGIVIDPVGAMLAVVVFEVTLAGQLHLAGVAMIVLRTVLVGSALGLAGAAIAIVLLRRMWVPDILHNPITLMLVVAAFAAANVVQHESGLFAVTVMGVALANQRTVHVRHIMEFKESLTVLLIGALFVVLGARLRLDQLAEFDWRTAAFIGALILVARPLCVAACTIRSPLTFRERLFLAALAPRGIVAAAVSSVFALRLKLENVGGDDASRIVPVTFAVIVGTVSVYGLTAAFTARRLGLSRPGARGFLIVGANRVARTIAAALQAEKVAVLMVDTNRQHVTEARLAGLQVVYASILSQYVIERVELSSIGRLMGLTPNEELDSLAAVQFGRLFGRSNVYQLASDRPTTGRREKVTTELRGRLLFGSDSTFSRLEDQLADGAIIKKTTITPEFTYAAFRAKYGDGAIPMLLLDDAGGVEVFTADHPPLPKPGQAIISLVTAAAAANAKEHSPTPVAIAKPA